MDLRKGGLLCLLVISVIISIQSGCSKTSVPYRAYHDLTARYNRYFNSKLIFTETFKQIEEQHKKDYNNLLRLYIYHDLENRENYYPQMDQVIKKESANIQIHENSKWSDDAYLHIGMAYYIKGNFEEALKAFTTVTSKFESGVRETPAKTDKERKKGKEDEYNPYYQGTGSFIQHKPARYESTLWIVRTYVQLEKFSEAQSVLALAKGDKDFPEPLYKELYKTETFYFLRRGAYLKGAESLKKAIEYTKDKKEQRRYFFLLAQLYEKNKNYELAIQYYKQVLDMKPNYEMEFHAKIKVARLSVLIEKYSNEYVIALLNDMLKNERYDDFKGEIYYTLGDLYLSEKLEEKAIENFRESVKNSAGNQEQKAQAFYQIAQFYFNNEEYVNAKAYYDSTLQFMSQETARYDTLNKRRNTLTGIVDRINIISREDSLLQLANLSPEELERMKKEEERKRQQKQEERQEEEQEEENFQPLISNNESETATAWPFDNSGQRSDGYNEFTRRWGQRPHIPLWRVRESSSIIISGENETLQEGGEPVASEDTTESESIFDEVPQSEEAMQASQEKIVDAYYELGGLYKEQLDNTSKAIETYETLLNKYPDNKYREQTAYRLYLLYKDRNMAKAEKYKDIVLNEYPNSVLAKVIKNPNYLEQQQQKENRVENYYSTTYDAFKADQYQQVLTRVHQSDSLYPGNDLKPKFEMLEALTYGKMQKYDSMRTKLEFIVNKYPFDEVKTKALAILNSMEGLAYGSGEVDGGQSKFRYEPSKTHFLAILFYTVGDTVSTVQTNLADYNGEYHSVENLKISSNLLNNEAQLVLVKDFNNAEKARNYYNEIRYNNKVFGELPKDKYEVFFISPHNYGVFFREKDVSIYMSFFTKNYLDNE